MQVNKIAGEIARTDALQRVHAPSSAPAPAGVASGEAATPRTDGVQISDTGRALASSTVPDEAVPTDIDALRANELRTKIFTGAYNALDSAEQVARAIIRSGDL